MNFIKLLIKVGNFCIVSYLHNMSFLLTLNIAYLDCIRVYKLVN